MHEQNILKVVILTILLGNISVIESSLWDFSSINYLNKVEEDTDFNSQLQNVFKDELQELRKELTASFVEEHTRRKRATENYEYEATLVKFQAGGGGQNENVTTYIVTDDTAATTVIFQDAMYILQMDGIYRIEGLDRNETNYGNNDGEDAITKVFISSWELTVDDRVLTTIEKNNVLFILTENRREGFSFLYTFSDASKSLVLRQRIRNHGTVTAAKFFTFYDQLFLIIANDNRVHSLTICPILQWMGTYLDEIHTIQTRGASAVETFVIEGYQYLAISQGLDAAGNSEIGTQVVRMNRRGELEKVQLLYSNSPVSLHFTKIYHEHILIIAQKKEPAIVYFFGGYDFVYLQHLPTLKGESVSIVSVLAPDGETYIFASNGHAVDIFVRAHNYSPLTSLMFSPYPNSTFTAPANSTIIGLSAKPPRFLHGQAVHSEGLVVAITYFKDYEAIVDLRTLVFVKKPKIASSFKEPEEKLSKCLVNLNRVLESKEPTLQQLLKSNATILRKNADMEYNGVLNSQTLLTVDSQKSVVENLRIQPNVNSGEEASLSPSQLQGRVLAGISDIQSTVNVKLQNVLIRDEENQLTGRLHFINGVSLKDLSAPYTQVALSSLNGVNWSHLRNNVLRNDNGPDQNVTGNWNVNQFQSKEIWTIDSLSGISLPDILLTESTESQTVDGHVQFRKNVEFRNGILIPPDQYINNIMVSDIVQKGSGWIEINGTKTARVVNAGTGTVVDRVNNIYLDQWYNSMLKTNGPDQIANGTYVFNGDFFAENLMTELVNQREWNHFINQVLIDGKHQTISDEAEFANLVVQHLQADEINGVQINDLFTTTSPQTIKTPVYVDSLVIHGHVQNELLNGHQLTENVVLKDSPSTTITGPVEFHNLTVNKIGLAEGILISDIDISEKTKETKTVVYTVKGNQRDSIAFTGQVFASNAETPYVNGIPISDFGSTHWKSSGHNTVSVANMNFSKYNVEIINSLSTAKLNHQPVEQYVTIHGGPADELIDIPIYFNDTVVVHGNLNFEETATLNNIDLSEFVKGIVTRGDVGLVRGVKTFTHPIVANRGIQVETINNLSIDEQVVMLRNGKSGYEIPGKTTFSDVQARLVIVNGKTTVGGTVNSYDLKNIQETTVYSHKPAVISSDVLFLSNTMHVEGLHVRGNLNNFSVLPILDQLIPLNMGTNPQNLAVNLIVKDKLEFQGPAQVDELNGVAPNEYFPALVNRNVDEFIQNQKVFIRPLTIDRDLNCEDGIINHINLQNLEKEALSTTKNQVVSGNAYFQAIQANNIHSPSICGFPTSDFVHTDDTTLSVINSPVSFIGDGSDSPTVLEGDIELDKGFNGHNIQQVAEHLTNIQGDDAFNSVTCKGNLMWNVPRDDTKELSYLYNHAVLNTGPGTQTVTGAVTFSTGFKTQTLTSYHWLNDVDLNRIATDAVFTDATHIDFMGQNSIPVIVIEENGSVEPLPTFSTVYLNRVNLEELNRKVVRKGSSQVIRGLKILNQDPFSEFLYTDEVNECPVENAARVNDNRTISPFNLESIHVSKDIKFHALEGYDWDNFLHSRVTFHEAQTISGNIIINGNLTVKNCQASRINNLNVQDLVLKNAEEIQVIKGQKTMGGLTVVGELQARTVNNYDIDHLYTKMLHKNESTVINQTVYFGGPVSIYKDIEVTHHINEDHNLDHISHAFESQLVDIITKANETDRAQERVLHLLEVLEKELQQSATWLEYFRFTSLADISHSKEFSKAMRHKERVEVTIFDNQHARLGFSTMIPSPSSQHGLPNDCLCNYVDFIELDTKQFKHIGSAQCKNIFELSSPFSDATFTIMSTYLSYNDTCRSSTPGITDVFTLPTGKIQATKAQTTASPVAVSRVDTGFITDAKAFHLNGIDYIVISQFYDHRKGAHKGQVSVYAVMNDSSLSLIQTIPTIGTIKLVLEYVNGAWIMGVANSYGKVPYPEIYESENEGEGSKPLATLSGIYVWITPESPYYPKHPDPSHPHGKFILFRDVLTKNVVDMEFIRVPPRSNDYTRVAFIAFLHSGNVIELYQFDWLAQNFYLDQTIAFDDDFQITALSSFSLKDSTYLVISSVPQGLIVYEYRCMEGFKKYLQVPLSGVLDISSLVLGEELFLPIASSYETFIAEGKVQGLFL